MPRILVDPEELRTLSGDLRRAADELRATARSFPRAMDGLAWESRLAVGMDAQASDAWRSAENLAGEAEALAGFAARKAEEFAAADRAGVEAMAGVAQAAAVLAQVGAWDAGGRLSQLTAEAVQWLRLGSLFGSLAGLPTIFSNLGWLRRLMPEAEPPAGPDATRLPDDAEVKFIQRVYGIDEQGYGPQTKKAVWDLQKQHGIEVDSAAMIGPLSWGVVMAAYREKYGIAAPAPAPATPAPAGADMTFQGVDLSKYFTPAEAKALKYTLTKEGRGFTTCHSSVWYEGKTGLQWDDTVLNFGIISFAFPVGGGYGVMHSLVNDPAAFAELEKLGPQYLHDQSDLAGFRKAFNSGSDGALAWFKTHAMADEHHLKPEWQGLLAAWEETEPNKKIQVEAVAGQYMASATAWAKKYGIKSERGLAFLFDVNVQHGDGLCAQWDASKGKLPWEQLDEQARLKVMLQADDVPDSIRRKAPIVNGGADFEREWNLSYARPWKKEG
ncbi:MAG TPA: hypothetical protein VGK74_12430 [Symbiobacteriaceae bacterium]|jgi:hypothetical protein